MIWDIDPAHSRLSFALHVMRVSTTRGSFKTLRGRIDIDEQHPASSWVEAAVEAASITTHNRLRDAHLRSAAFLDLQRYPRITFRSTHVERVSDHEYHVTGNLTLHGITRPITFHVASDRQTEAASMGERAHLSASVTIKRNDFGVGQGVGVRFAASSLVSIEVELDVVRQLAEAHQPVLAVQ